MNDKTSKTVTKEEFEAAKKAILYKEKEFAKTMLEEGKKPQEILHYFKVLNLDDLKQIQKEMKNRVKDYVTYRDVVGELTLILIQKLGTKFNKLIVKDIEGDCYGILSFVILNVPEYEVKDAVNEELANALQELKLKYNLVVHNVYTAKETWDKAPEPVKIKDKYLDKGIFTSEQDMLDVVCMLQKEKCFRDKIRELYNKLDIGLYKICQLYNLSADEAETILNNNDDDLDKKMWWTN